ncbi:hypothetical protein GGR52DRAFT_7625 [Hypoxylon sp. FL1284]|nr:hypothetical protein GGR52DRAFT_7625 [Hypoxylon sp. FL1284]
MTMLFVRQNTNVPVLGVYGVRERSSRKLGDVCRWIMASRAKVRAGPGTGTRPGGEGVGRGAALRELLGRAVGDSDACSLCRAPWSGMAFLENTAPEPASTVDEADLDASLLAMVALVVRPRPRSGAPPGRASHASRGGSRKSCEATGSCSNLCPCNKLIRRSKMIAFFEWFQVGYLPEYWSMTGRGTGAGRDRHALPLFPTRSLNRDGVLIARLLVSMVGPRGPGL